MDQVHKCIASRRALLGLDAPTRIAPTSPDGEAAYHTHVMIELMRIAEQAKGGLVVIDAEYVERHVQGAIAHDESEDTPQEEKKVHNDHQETD